MLRVTDSGCTRHAWRQFRLAGSDGELMTDILYNLPREGDYHTFICEHGQTHRLSFIVQAEHLANRF